MGEYIRYTIFAIALLWLNSSAVAATGSQTKWQLLFYYDSTGIELVDAGVIPPLKKAIRTPGLKAAPARIGYNLEWFDQAGDLLLATSFEFPLGVRSTVGDTEPCRLVIPSEGWVVVRTEGPPVDLQPEAIRMTKTRTAIKAATSGVPPPSFDQTTITLALPAPRLSLAPDDGPLSVEKIRHTGSDYNRLVIVIMSDGYTQADLDAGLFEAAAGGLEADFVGKDPWGQLLDATNIYRVDIASNEQGADNETYGVMKDTYLNSSYWVNDIERLLSLTGNGYTRAYDAANALVGYGAWDILLVLVNSSKYGGSGGSIAVSSVHSAASEIVLHELGHSFGNLADEYETAYPGYPGGDSEPNVDFDYEGAGLKWLIWVEAGTPLPTPEYSGYDNFVGAFEGARYLSSGIYRPWENCEMRSLGRIFCPVCAEAHMLEFTDQVATIDDSYPYPGMTLTVDRSGQFFWVQPLTLPGFEYQWFLDGVPLSGATDTSLILVVGDMVAPVQTLSLEMSLPTPLVRQATISSSYSWTVEAVPDCCSGIVGDANFDGQVEPTIGDVAALVDHLFVTRAPLECYREADVNQSGGVEPVAEDITIADIAEIIDNLFITRAPLPDCL